jgi:glycosyltransferase involved in cell wall biosynthesis
MRVLIYAPQATSAMRHIVESLACELARHVEVVLYRPNTAGELERGAASSNLTLVQFKGSRYRALRGLAHCSPLRQYREAIRLRALRPDLIHVFNGEGYLLPALMLRMMAGVPMVVTLHDPVPHPGDLIARLTTGITQMLVYRRAASIHVFAEVFREHLAEHEVPPGRVYVTRLGSVAEVFTRHDTSRVARENAALLFGRLEYYKGIDVLVDAGLALAARGKPRRIIIAGPGRIPRKLRARILAHPEIFELHNRFVPDDEAAILLKRSSTCVLPYHQATQSCLPPIADAYCQRIIASRSGSFIEEIPRLGGVLVTPGSVEELAQALADDQESGSSPIPRPEMYAWPAIADSLLNAYRETLERFHRAPARTASRSEAHELGSA